MGDEQVIDRDLREARSRRKVALCRVQRSVILRVVNQYGSRHDSVQAPAPKHTGCSLSRPQLFRDLHLFFLACP
jgi:hypothetical protein